MAELDDIVQRMIDAGESEDNIAAVIKEYDNVAVKKKDDTKQEKSSSVSSSSNGILKSESESSSNKTTTPVVTPKPVKDMPIDQIGNIGNIFPKATDKKQEVPVPFDGTKVNPKSATQYPAVPQSVDYATTKEGKDISNVMWGAFGEYEKSQKALSDYDKKLSEVSQSQVRSVKDYQLQGESQFLQESNQRLKEGREPLKIKADAVLEVIKGEIQKIIDIAKNKYGLEYFSKINKDGEKVADVNKVESWAKSISKKAGVPEGGYAERMLYNTMKAQVDFKPVADKIKAEQEKLIRQKYGKSFDEVVSDDQKKYLDQFSEGKQIEERFKLQAKEVEMQTIEPRNKETKALGEAYKQTAEKLKTDYESLDAEQTKKIEALSQMYKEGKIPYEVANQQINEATRQRVAIQAEINKQIDKATTDYLTQNSYVNSKYNKQYQRMIAELSKMAESEYRKVAEKYSGGYKIPENLKKDYEETYKQASKKVTDNENWRLFDKDVDKNIIGLFGQRLVHGLGGTVKAFSTSLGVRAGELIGDKIQNNRSFSDQEIKDIKDFFNPTKFVGSAGETMGGMLPMIGGQAALATLTSGMSIPAQMALQGVFGVIIEGAQSAGTNYDQVFSQTGSVTEANKAFNKTMKGYIALFPLAAMDGLPFIGKATLGIKRWGTRALVKGGIETGTETIQETFQNRVDDIANNIKEEDLRSMFDVKREDFINAGLNTAPTTFLMGGAPTVASQTKKSIIESWGKAYATKESINKYSGSARNQFIYDLVQKRGADFTKAYTTTLFNNGEIPMQTLYNINNTIETSLKIQEDAKAFGLTKPQSKVYAAMVFDLENKKNSLSSLVMSDEQKTAAKQTIGEAQKRVSDFLSTKKGDYVVVTHSDMSQQVLTYDEAEKLFDDIDFVKSLSSGTVSVLLERDKGEKLAKVLEEKMKANIEQVKNAPEQQPPATNEVVSNTETPVNTAQNIVNQNQNEDGKGQEAEGQKNVLNQPAQEQQQQPVQEVNQQPAHTVSSLTPEQENEVIKENSIPDKVLVQKEIDGTLDEYLLGLYNEKLKAEHEAKIKSTESVDTGQKQNNSTGVQQTPQNNTGVQQTGGETGLSNQTEVSKKKEEVKPIRQLGTGANVYFETPAYRVNSTRNKGEILLNINGEDGGMAIANIKFDNAKEAVRVAESLQRDFPNGIPSDINAEKYVEATRESLNKQNDTKTTSTTNQPVSEVTDNTKQQGTEKTVQQGIDATGQGNAEITASDVNKSEIQKVQEKLDKGEQLNGSEIEIADKNNLVAKLNTTPNSQINTKLAQDENEHQLAESKLTAKDNIEQEPSIKAIESKAESNNEAELNEVVKQADELINKSTDVVNVPVSDIKINEKEYQGRKNKFSERSANNVANNFDANKFDPIVIYNHPDGNTYVLSGHSRLEGMKRRGEKTIPARYFEGTPEEAKEFALKSNKLATLQTDLENANYYREQLKQGRSYNSVLEEAKAEEQPGSAKRIISIAHLNPDGKAIDALEKTEGAEGDGSANLMNIATKIGDIRAKNEHITDAHENELFEYMMQDKDNIPTDKELADSNSPINRSINSVRFDNTEPLNLDKFQNKSDARLQWEKEKKELEQQISDLRKEVNPSKSTGWTGLKEKAIASISKDKSQQAIDKAEQDFNNDVNDIRTNYQKLLERKRAELTAVSNKLAKHLLSEKNLIEGEKNQQSLFQSEPSSRFRTITKKAFDKLVGKLMKAFPNVKVFTSEETLKEKLKEFGNKYQDIKTKDGTIYGAKFPDGSIYLNPNELNANTPIHEFGHIWEQAFNARFKAGIEILKQSEKGRAYIERVRNNPAYKDKTEQEIEREALVTAIGDKGEQMSNATNFDKFKKWISDLFKAIGDKLFSATNGKIGRQLTAEDTLEDFTKMAVGELTGGEILNEQIGNNNDTPKEGSIRFMTLPDGRKVSVRDMGVDVVNGFYSPIEKRLAETKIEKQSANKWLGIVGKGEEAKWTGLTDWLAQQQGSVSKADIQQYLKDNRIQVVEVVKGEDMPNYKLEVEPPSELGADRMDLLGDLGKAGNLDNPRFREYLNKKYGKNGNKIYDWLAENATVEGTYSKDTKFSQYQLEGEKENYKEVLVTLPSRVRFADKWAFYQSKGYNKEQFDALPDEKKQDLFIEFKSEDKKQRESSVADFKSSHFDEPNILVHLRMNTRTDAEGKKVLFLEEVQSDWGQKGKKEGFKDDAKQKQWDELEKQRQALWDEVNEKHKGQIVPPLLQQKINEVVKKQQALYEGLQTPSAPFVTDTNAWTKLGLKVALKEAVKQGADKIAWSTGTQQFDRWGSEKIDWVKTPTENYEIRKDSLSGEWIVTIDAMGVNGKNKAALRIGFPTEKEAKDYVNKGSWQIAINEQVGGTAFEGINIDEKALSERGIAIISKEDLRAAFAKNLKRERNDAEIDKLTDRIWNRMQTEDSGTSLPRKEGMEEFYGNPKDMERAKDFTVKKEGDVFAVKDEKGKTIRTFKQENEANKFKENYGLGIVGNVAKSLFKQEPKTIDVFQSDKLASGWSVTTKDINGNVQTNMFDSKSKGLAWLSEQEGLEVLSSDAEGKNYSTQHSIDITPELIAEVQGGLPMFQISKKEIYDTVREMRSKGVSDERIRKVLSLTGNTQKEIDDALSGEGEVFGIKKALVPQDIVDSMPFEKMTDKQMMETGKQLVESGNINPSKLVGEVIDGVHEVLTPAETTALIYYRTQLSKEIDERLAALRSAIPNTAEYANARRQYEAKEAEMRDYQAMQLITARNQSMAFRLRKLIVNSEYSAQEQIRRYKAANVNGNYTIPKELEKKFIEMEASIKKLQEELETLEQQKKLSEQQQAVQNIKNSVTKKSPSNSSRKQKAKALIAEGLDELAQFLGAITKLEGNTMPQLTKIFTKIGRGLIEGGQATIENVFEKIKEAVTAKYGNKTDIGGYESSVMEELNNQYTKAFIKNDELKVPYGIIKNLVENGYDTIETLSEKVREMVLPYVPGTTITQVRDAITKYGQLREDNRDDIDKHISKMKRIGQLMSKIEDARAKRRPKRSGKIWDAPSPEERRMQQELNELLKDIPLDEAEAEALFKTALDKVKSRLRNRIADLNEQLETGKKVEKSKGVEYDKDAKELAAEVELLLQKIEDKYGKPVISYEQRLKTAKKAIQTAIDKYEKKINERNFTKQQRDELVPDEELKAQQEILQALKDEYNEMYAVSEEAEAQRTSTYKKQLDRKKAELERRIREKDYETKKRKPSPYDEGIHQKQIEIQKLQDEFEKEQELNRLENRTFGEKAYDTILGILGIPRMLRTTIDLSAPFRQGIRLMAGHPIHFVKAFAQMHKMAVSKDAYEKFMTELRQTPEYATMVQAGLSITDATGIQRAREEQFWNNIISNTLENKSLNSVTFGIPKMLDNYTLRFSERGYTGFINMMRINVFLDGVRLLEKQGMTIHDNKDAYKALAQYVNTATGRGDISALGKSAEAFNAILFSPRMLASIYQYPASVIKAMATNTMPKHLRLMIVKDAMSFVGFGMLVLTLANGAYKGYGDDDEEDNVENDPRSSDFGKFRAGSSRYDIWAGYLPLIRTLYQIKTKEQKSTSTGEIKKLDGSTYGGDTAADKLISFFANKLSPNASIFWQYMRGTDSDFRPFEWKNVPKQLFLPMSIEQITDGLEQDEGTQKIIINSILNFYGVGVQQYKQPGETGKSSKSGSGYSEGKYKSNYENTYKSKYKSNY